MLLLPYLQSRRKVEDASTITNDVNDVIASSHGLQLVVLRSTVLLGRTRCQVFVNHFSGYPRPRKAKVKISEMTAGIWQSLPPLSAPLSPTLDKSLNSEHPVSRGAKFGQLAEARFALSAGNDFNSQVTMRLTVRGRFRRLMYHDAIFRPKLNRCIGVKAVQDSA